MARRILAGLLLLLVVAVAPTLHAAPAAPAFSVRLLDRQERIDTHDLIGKKVLVLRFQASWCKPCVRESAALTRVTERYRGRGVEVLAIHVQDAVKDAREFVRAQKPAYLMALDPRLAIGNRFGFRGTPYTVVIDLRGEMVARLHGESVVARLPRILDAALAAAGRPTGRL